MKQIKPFAIALASVAVAVFSSCENDNINPYDYTGNVGSSENEGSKDVIKTALAEYPIGSIVWTHDTTLNESVEVPEGVSLYIEQGVTVTCSSSAKVPVEIVVLGNLYCMGTADKPVVITSDTKKPADWGGIICQQSRRCHSKTSCSRPKLTVVCPHSISATSAASLL